MNPFVGYDNIMMLLEPKDIGTTATTCPYMQLKNAQEAAFLVIYGAITSDTATDGSTITIEAATAEGGTEAAIGFSYRLSGALGANTWGSITAVTTTGVEVLQSSDNVMVWVELPLDEMAANDYRVARVKLTDTDDLSACLVAVLGFTRPRYKQSTHLSATASASA